MQSEEAAGRRPGGFLRLLQELEEEHDRELRSLRTQLEGELEYLRVELERLRCEAKSARKSSTKASAFAASSIADPSPRARRGQASHAGDLQAASPGGSKHVVDSLAVHAKPSNATTVTEADSMRATSLDLVSSPMDHSPVMWRRAELGAPEEAESVVTGCGVVPTAPVDKPLCTKLVGDWDVADVQHSDTNTSRQTSHRQQAAVALQASKEGWPTTTADSAVLPLELPEGSMAVHRHSSCDNDEASEPGESGPCAEDSQKMRDHDRCMLSPVSRLRLVWDSVAFSCLIFDLLLTPFELVYLAQEAVPYAFTIINHCITFFFVVDIGFNFNTGYIERDKLILKRNLSMRKYFRCWFWLDFIATIPYDIVATTALSGVNGDVLSMTRLAKVSKVLKTLRFLKMLRAVRLVQQMNTSSSFFEIFAPLRYLIVLSRVLVLLALLAHLHGCIWALLQPGWKGSDSVQEAFMHYYRSFNWAYQAITVGAKGDSDGGTPGIWTLEMVIASERIMLAALLGSWLVVKAMSLFQEGAQLTLVKQDAMRFFRQHEVSIETQIQVMYSLHETRAAQQMQRHFKQLMSEHLPEELRRAISEELWTTRLMSLGLILHVKQWHEDFLLELCLVVREEVLASKTILCKEGNAAISAYYVINGRLTVVSSSSYGTVPDFIDGMWVGELALVNPTRRRNATVVTQMLTTLMTVPVESFTELISRLGLQGRFDQFRKAQLAQGLCGRCGVLGDHFTHACPLAQGEALSRIFGPARRGRRRRHGQDKEGHITESRSIQLDEFLHAHRLSRLGPILYAQGIDCLDRVESMDINILRDRVRTERDKDLMQQVELLHELQMELQGQLDADIRPEHHLAFLSHYKLEAGTEAALMHSELEKALHEEPDGPCAIFKVPVFLDSEDLYDLKDLQEKVRASHNLLLLLTKSVLSRPWVLVEVVTAVQAGVRLLPVQLLKTGSNFEFPEENFYADLLAGKFLDESGTELLKQHGITLGDVEGAIREVFKKISVPYSPHRPESIRKAEIKALLKQCSFCPKDEQVSSKNSFKRTATDLRETRMIPYGA